MQAVMHYLCNFHLIELRINMIIKEVKMYGKPLKGFKRACNEDN